MEFGFVFCIERKRFSPHNLGNIFPTGNKSVTDLIGKSGNDGRFANVCIILMEEFTVDGVGYGSYVVCENCSYDNVGIRHRSRNVLPADNVCINHLFGNDHKVTVVDHLIHANDVVLQIQNMVCVGLVVSANFGIGFNLFVDGIPFHEAITVFIGSFGRFNAKSGHNVALCHGNTGCREADGACAFGNFFDRRYFFACFKLRINHDVLIGHFRGKTFESYETEAVFFGNCRNNRSRAKQCVTVGEQLAVYHIRDNVRVGHIEADDFKVVSGHLFHITAPAGEGVPFSLRHFGANNFIIGIEILFFDHFTVNGISKNVGCAIEICNNRYIMRGHNGREIKPTVKRGIVYNDILGQLNFCTICKGKFCNFFFCNGKYEIVFVDCEFSFNFNVGCGHDLGKRSPLQEAVAFFGGSLNGRYDRHTFGEASFIVKFTANHEANGVYLATHITVYGNVGRRHSCGQIFPTGKALTVFGFGNGSFDFITEGKGDFAVELAIKHISQLVCNGCIFTVDNDIVSRHLLGSVEPTRESIPFFCRNFGGIDFSARRLYEFSDDRAVDDKFNAIYGFRVFSCKREITVGHGFGNILPADKGLVFFRRTFWSGQRFAKRESFGGNHFTVCFVADSVNVAHVFTGNGKRAVFFKNGFLPAVEGIAFSFFGDRFNDFVACKSCVLLTFQNEGNAVCSKAILTVDIHIVVRHFKRNVFPTEENETGHIDRVCRNNGLAVCISVGMYFLASCAVDQLEFAAGHLTVDLNICRRHGFGAIRPAFKYVSFFEFGSELYGVTERNVFGIIQNFIDKEICLVTSGIHTGYHFHIVVGHHFRQLSETAEVVAFLFGVGLFADRCAVGQIFFFEHFPVDDSGQLIKGHCESTGYGNIFSRHRCRSFRPAAEGVIFLLRNVHFRDGLAKEAGEREGGVTEVTVAVFDNVVHVIGLRFINRHNVRIFAGHRYGEVAPFKERTALERRRFGRKHGRAVRQFFARKLFAVCQKAQLIFSGNKGAVYHDVSRGHSGRNLIPAGESMKLFFRFGTCAKARSLFDRFN